jgi:hypothetical protein
MSTISSQSFRLKKDIIGILLNSVYGREKEVESLRMFLLSTILGGGPGKHV